MTTFSAGATGSIIVSVKRYGGYTLVEGKPIMDPQTEFDIEANIQPASADDLVRVPEGQRDRDIQVVFTSTELFSANKTAERKADRIQYNGKAYEVFNAATYRMGVLDHTEALMIGEQ